jgi:ligand-binding sensor domain-containing protein
VDPSGDAWFGGSDRSTRFRYVSSTGDMSRPNYWQAQRLSEAKESAWNRLDLWPDAVGEPQASRPEQRTSDNISGITLANDGSVWVGSFSRGLAQMTREGAVLRQFSTELVDGKGYVSSVAADPIDDSVWAGTSWGGGLSRVRGNTIMHYNHTVFGLDLAMSRVSDIQVDTSGPQRRVLVAFMGYQRNDDKRWVAGTIGIYTGE